MWESHVLLWIHAHRSPELDRVFLFSRFLGDTLTLSLVVLAVAIGLAWRRETRAGATWIAAGVVTLMLGWGVKLAAARPRPHLWPWLVPPHGYSFPSGHALGSSMVYTLLAATLAARAPRWRGRAYAAAGVVIFYIGFGRLYLGVHWPTDVLAGWALGMTIAMLARQRLRRSTDHSDRL